jgi:methylmalonyl-CoA mutase
MTDTLPPIPDELVLAGEFPTPSRGDWQRLVARVLHGSAAPDELGDPEAELATTVDGIVISPLYTADDAVGPTGYPGQAPFVRGAVAGDSPSGWDVRQRHGHPDPTIAREQIIEDLEGGVTSVWLQLGAGHIPVDALPEVLTDVYLDLATVVLDAGPFAAEAAESLLAVAKQRGVAAEEFHASLGLDPVGVLARTGRDPGLGDAVTWATRCADAWPHVRAVTVDALSFHEAGGSIVDELGCSIAAGVQYLRAMDEAGMPIAEALSQLEFRYAATADQFATIAKFRAARRLWARVAESCGVTGAEAGQRQHAVTSWPMMTRRDPWNNILRATLAAMAAGVGGAESVTVLPFDAAIGLPDALARRVARNIHPLLVEESNVAKVVDPAGGSWYVESLTAELAEHAWSWFQQIERAGGAVAALNSGQIAERLAASRDAQLSAVARGTAAITGVSEFPRLGEALLHRDAIIADPLAGGGLPVVRWSERHEDLRDRADAIESVTGSPPTVALVPMGDGRASTARADAAAALLAPAGIVAAVTELDEAVRVSPVVCLCCADDVSDDELAAAATALRAAGASRVMAAGGSTETATNEIDDRIVAGMDRLAFASRTLETLENLG